MNRIVLAIAIGLLVAGCSRNANPTAAGDAKTEALAAEDPIGYYEIASGQSSVYVLGSMQSVDRFRAGKMPAKTIRRYDPKGRQIFFEADGLVLEKRLIGEYSRRHGSID